jgi:nucleoside-diphosphate-sugar epimerase
MKSIVLTGATSMIGIALIKQCIQNNIAVLALVRPRSSRINRMPNSDLVTIVDCDLDGLTNFSSFSDIMSPIDVFYHIGWDATDKKGRNSCEKQLRNIKYVLNAVSLAKKLGCKKFIGIGSQAEYGNFSKPLNENVPVNPDIAYGVARRLV